MYQSETKICQNCQQDFIIETEDFEFYDKIKVPPPTWCPECRMIRRMNWRNERTLYKRKCDAPGHNEDIISVYHKDSPFKVYDQKYWWSDNWDAMSYGNDYDFNKPFFEQFEELIQKVPKPNINNVNPINSDYVNYTTGSKNCYLIFSSGAANPNENCLYGYRLDGCRDCVDNSFIINSENCYGVIDGRNCNKVFWSRYVENCIDCQFLYDCKNCSNCFGCVGLRNKNYCIFTQQYSKEKYFEKLKELFVEDYKRQLEINNTFKELILKFPHRYSVIIRSYNATGDDINNSKNCFDVFYIANSEDSKFIIQSPGGIKGSYDILNGKGELLYEDWAVFDSYNVYFSSIIISCNKSLYCSEICQSSSNLFGCVSLRNKQYCILNKQYSKEDYERLVPQIIDHMNNMPYIDKKGRIYKYGEFFPSELSPFSYNETIAQEYFPLTKEQAIDKGYSWKDTEKRQLTITMTNDQLPDHIKDVKDDIVNQIIECQHQNNPPAGGCNEQCTQAFKIIQTELDFYRKMNRSLPRLCPNCRHYQRLKQRNPLKLWKRKCQCAGTQSDNGIYQNTITHIHNQNHCENEFETTYSPDRLEIVYCEKCYQLEVV